MGDFTPQEIIRAKQLHYEVEEAVRLHKKSFIDLSLALKRMKDAGLWRVISPYRCFGDYVTATLGAKFSDSKINILTRTAEVDIPEERIRRIGHTKSAQVARLKPEYRTEQVLSMAESETESSFRQSVNNLIISNPESRMVRKFQAGRPLKGVVSGLLRNRYPVELLEEFRQHERMSGKSPAEFLGYLLDLYRASVLAPMATACDESVMFPHA